MVSASLEAAGVSHFIQGQHLVGNVKRYKPAVVVYQDLLQSLGKTKDPQNVWLVSGYVEPTPILPRHGITHLEIRIFYRNPFDVSGARSSGMRAIWVDRAGRGWVDRCLEPSVGGPTKIVKSLREVKAIIDAEL